MMNFSSLTFSFVFILRSVIVMLHKEYFSNAKILFKLVIIEIEIIHARIHIIYWLSVKYA